MSLTGLSLAELRQIIDDEALAVAKHVGGAARRTKADIADDIRLARLGQPVVDDEELIMHDDTDEEPESPLLPDRKVAGMRVLRYVVGPMSAAAQKEVSFADVRFGNRCITLESPTPTLKSAEVPTPAASHDGAQFELLACKKVSDGTGWHGAAKYVWRWVYVARKDGVPLAEELQQIANFAALPNARKATARLELLLSPAKSALGAQQLSSADFELIDEPLGSLAAEAMGDGCGFISDEMCARLAGPDAVAVQVRVFAPRLGVFKGMLMRRHGVRRIQLTPSMRKVGPSPLAADDGGGAGRDDGWATLIVKQCHPTMANAALSRRLAALGEPPPPPHKPLSDHVLSLLEACGAPPHALDEYKKAKRAEHAMVVGVADPTRRLPAGSVFVTGLPAERHGHAAQIFVSRCPCVKVSDGRMPPLITAHTRPAGIPDAEWAWLLSLPFGAVVFSTLGECPLPAMCASGDLDGDYYFVSWSPLLLPHLRQRPMPPSADAPSALPAAAAAGSSSPSPSPSPSPSAAAAASVLGEGWLAAAQAHMTSPEVMREGKDVGPCFKAWERLANDPAFGWEHPDTVSLGECYLALLDLGKHGGAYPVDELPLHLRKLGSVGRPPRAATGSRPTTRAQTAAAAAAGAEAAEEADATADGPRPPPPPPPQVQELTLDALRALIAREGLDVKGNVGGKARRTKADIAAEVALALAARDADLRSLD